MFDPAINSDQDFQNWIEEQKQSLSLLPSNKDIEIPVDDDLKAALDEVERTGTNLFVALDVIEKMSTDEDYPASPSIVAVDS
ncbi:MAG: hypothetical protein E6R05_05690 [Candidatus Moraniibacteriota bacterium]|nr:MAG: hypothetical protein E6R05_05690 [Candidatus Moranbacteria bacterium]